MSCSFSWQFPFAPPEQGPVGFLCADGFRRGCVSGSLLLGKPNGLNASCSPQTAIPWFCVSPMPFACTLVSCKPYGYCLCVLRHKDSGSLLLLLLGLLLFLLGSYGFLDVPMSSCVCGESRLTPWKNNVTAKHPLCALLNQRCRRGLFTPSKINATAENL